MVDTESNQTAQKDESMLLLETECLKTGITLSDFQKAQFETFFKLVTEKNEVMNLTAITERREFFIKHFCDSLSAASYLAEGASVIDVGCGAGFPSVPLKIARPDLKITALDSTGKKIDFVKEAAEKLGLAGFTAVFARAEDLARGSLRETFDAAVSRAVANLSALSELCLPFVKMGGLFIAYKTDESETETAANAAKELGARLKTSQNTVLPNGDRRLLLVYEKFTATNTKYPRNFGQIKKKPL